MIHIEDIIELVKPIPDPIMKSSDIKEESGGCISCKVCGSISFSSIDRSLTENVLQREYSVVNSSTEKKIIASIGAASCVILCMRNRKTTETILAHIDDPSIDFIRPFLKIDPYYADIYLIGGMYSFKDTVHRILLELQKNHYYHLTFCHIIDNESNDFAIDCRNGETWLNSEVGDIPYTEKEEGYIEMFSKFRMYFQKELNKKR